MQREILKKANELKIQIDSVDSFIYGYRNTWKQGFLKRWKSILKVGHKGYGYFKSEEMICDKELSELIYQTLLQYQLKIHREFENLGKEGNQDE